MIPNLSVSSNLNIKKTRKLAQHNLPTLVKSNCSETEKKTCKIGAENSCMLKSQKNHRNPFLTSNVEND